MLQSLKVGQKGQALVYIANAVPSGSGLQNLGLQGLNLPVENRLLEVENIGGGGSPNASTFVTVRGSSGFDMFQLIGRNLKLDATYVVEARRADYNSGSKAIPLADFVASTPAAGGCATTPQVLAFFKFFGVYDIDSLVLREVGAAK